jgi:hypothetical protein
MRIPYLPDIFEKELFMRRTLLNCFAQLPKPFMMIINPTKYQPIDDYANMSFLSFLQQNLERMSIKLENFSKLQSHLDILVEK